MSSTLQSRAAKFLARPIPEELKPSYTPNSLADIVISQCATGEEIDPELLDIAGMAAAEYDEAIERAETDDLKEYYRECQSILAELIDTEAGS